MTRIQIGKFPLWIDPTEAKIINKVITKVLANDDRYIRVNDGEEDATGLTRDRAKIQAETCQTDFTIYEVYSWLKDGNAHRIGNIILIHGNGEDVVSDASWNPDYPDSKEIIGEILNAVH